MVPGEKNVVMRGKRESRYKGRLYSPLPNKGCCILWDVNVITTLSTGQKIMTYILCIR